MIRFLIKGLLRDRSRSLFPVLMVSAGVFLTVLLYSVIQGTVSDMVDSNARFETGHLKIITRAYSEFSDQMPNDLALLNISKVMNTLKADYPDMLWAPRIKFGGLIDVPDEEGDTLSQGPVFGIGVDIINPQSPDISILNLNKAIMKGTLPTKRNEILISENYADKLGVTVGDTVTLMSSTMFGSMSIHNFKIAGTVRFGMVVLDRSMIIADIRDVRDALDMEDGASEVMGFRKDMIYDDKEMSSITESLNKSFNSDPSDEGQEFTPVAQRLGEQGILKLLLTTTKTIMSIISSIFILAMSIVLWNSGLMNGLRRYGEIGIRLAMGEPKGDIYRSMIIESVCIGVVGSIIGTAAGLAVSYWMQYVGIDFGSMMQKYTIIMSTVFRARVTETSYFIGFIPGIFASVIGTMFAGIGIYRRQTSQLFRELEV
ncbi:ABC transporter permease [Thermodesulfobacteriota bacterium]